MKKNYKPVATLLLLIGLCLVVGGTIAYYTSSDTFNNEFNTGTYVIQTQENFVSPDNWTPGTTTPKTVIATNKGSTPAAVRIKLTPSWVDANGDPLPLKDYEDVEAARIDFSIDSYRRWIYEDGYYYYKRVLKENQSTTPLFNSVTFNPSFEIYSTNNCEEENGVTTCTTEYNYYAGGKYTLQIDIETCQFDKYKEIWNTDIYLQESIPDYSMLMQQSYDENYIFGKEIGRRSFKSIVMVDEINIPANAIDSWDASEEGDGEVIAWYTDVDNDNKYELYIGQEGGVRANIDSSNTFSLFANLELIDLTNFDTSNVTNMSYMFYLTGTSVETFNIVGLDGFDTSSVTNMSYMFGAMGTRTTILNVGNLDNWDTSKVVDMSGMFTATGKDSTMWNVGDLSGWNTSNVTDMSYMFFGAGARATNFNLDLSNWNTSKVTNMEVMFGGAGQYSTMWNVGDLSGWNTSSVTNMSGMFRSAGYSATTWSVGNIGNWNVSKVTNMSDMFAYAGAENTAFNIDLTNWDTSSVTNMQFMFQGVGYNSTALSIVGLSNWNISNVTNMQSMFSSAGYSATTWSIGDLSNWDTSKVTNMQSMFQGAGNNAATFNIGTLKVYANNLAYMFENCKNVKATINLYRRPSNITRMFTNAATVNGSSITVNYLSAVTNINSIISTKSSNSNVVKGSQLD